MDDFAASCIPYPFHWTLLWFHLIVFLSWIGLCLKYTYLDVHIVKSWNNGPVANERVANVPFRLSCASSFLVHVHQMCLIGIVILFYFFSPNLSGMSKYMIFEWFRGGQKRISLSENRGQASRFDTPCIGCRSTISRKWNYWDIQSTLLELIFGSGYGGGIVDHSLQQDFHKYLGGDHSNLPTLSCGSSMTFNFKTSDVPARQMLS